MHGTSITLICQLTSDNLGTDGPSLDLDIPDDTSIQLPEQFAIVPYVEDVGGDCKLNPLSDGSARPVRKAWESEVISAWLSHVRNVFAKGKLEKNWQLEEFPVTFSGFFSKQQPKEHVKPRAVVGTFPVFSEEKADSISMQKHAMKVVKDGIRFLNEEQTPVMEGDLPLFA